MNDVWLKIINDLRSDPRDLHTTPKTNKKPLWFFACTDGTFIYVSNAKNHSPSTNISVTRKLGYAEFERIFPIHLRRERGESISIEAALATKNQAYWYSIFNFCLLDRIPETSQIIPMSKSINPTPQKDNFRSNIISENTVDHSASNNVMTILGHDFKFIQNLSPERNGAGNIKIFFPQQEYQNINHLPLNTHGNGGFCRFFVSCEHVPGVYLWIMDNEIIYIGEASDLKKRFNQGYGNISPRNCFVGGQSTNCKMNKVVLKHSSEGKIIQIYFCPTDHHKELELKLLRSIRTRYNAKDN